MTGIVSHIATVGAGVGAAGALALSGTAHAATTDDTAAARTGHQITSSSVTPKASWKFIDSYFWGSDCINAGNRGVDNGAWQTYECTGGGTWSDYNLWVWN